MIDPNNPDFANPPGSRRTVGFEYSPEDFTAPPAVTIATPFYNTGAIFEETARTVMGQSFQQWEWLIVNDGSADPESLAILDAYRHRDVRIRVIDHASNRGLSAARNTGFHQAGSNYIVMLDSDDLLEPTAIEKWFWHLQSYPEYSFVHGYSVGFGALKYLWQRGFSSGSMSLDENQIDHTSMVRCDVHQAVGGFDESITGGLEDWEFWLRCANSQYWGNTIPEYLNWYRRRPTQGDRWSNWSEQGLKPFRDKLRQRYPALWKGGFPKIRLRWHMPNDIVPDTLPATNCLRKQKRRLLMIVPQLTMGGADKFNLDLVRMLSAHGWELTVAVTLKSDYCWLPEFGRYTSDIFVLHNIIRPIDHPRFLKYLIGSRRPDLVLISNSELGYRLLPYLRASCPEVSFTDFGHAEHEDWNNGGYPRLAVDYQALLDLNITASEHLKQWMGKQGA
jgi:GT2 family glycosyltransferase